uniref:pectate lyase n=1 Tax=Meloidogyne javanica TaxID=6303 RepID=A0A915LUU3_MELJA
MPLLSLALNQEGMKFCNFPTPTSTNVTTETLHITKDTNFGMKRIIFNGKPNTCRPDIPGWNNDWDHAIIIENGVTISNLILGESPIGTSSDIICRGNCTLKNVYIENTCWRGFSFIEASDAKPGEKEHIKYDYVVEGGAALDGFQKIMVQGGPGRTTVKNFCSVNNAMDGNRQYNDKLILGNIEIYGNNNPTTKIDYVCSEYPGEIAPAADRWKYAYKPGEAGTSDKFCNYPASAVKIIN